jgi:hypothetical protein
VIVYSPVTWDPEIGSPGPPRSGRGGTPGRLGWDNQIWNRRRSPGQNAFRVRLSRNGPCGPSREGDRSKPTVGEEPMKSERDGISPAVEPSGTGCVECLALGGWWLHLRRCAECGHVGCCDNSPNQHASKHHAATGHPIITSFEPDEHWFYDYRTEEFFAGPKLKAPHSHPSDQPVPGPAGAVPSNWQTLLRE